MTKTTELSAGQRRMLVMIKTDVSAWIAARGGKASLADAARALVYNPAHVALAFELTGLDG
jgi:hypothetical protein